MKNEMKSYITYPFLVELCCFPVQYLAESNEVNCHSLAIALPLFICES